MALFLPCSWACMLLMSCRKLTWAQYSTRIRTLDVCKGIMVSSCITATVPDRVEVPLSSHLP